MKKFILLLCVTFFIPVIANAHPTLQNEKFINSLVSEVNSINKKINSDRCKVTSYLRLFINKTIKKGSDNLSNSKLRYLRKLSIEYGLGRISFSSKKDFMTLLDRMNPIPVALVASTAVANSNWGKSTMYKNTNNPFLMKCTIKGCGRIDPNRVHNHNKTQSEQYYEIRRFNSLKSAIKSYFLMLNSDSKYNSFRRGIKSNDISSSYLLSLMQSSTKALQVLERYKLDFYDDLYPHKINCSRKK